LGTEKSSSNLSAPFLTVRHAKRHTAEVEVARAGASLDGQCEGSFPAQPYLVARFRTRDLWFECA
jgi:hypothetical protein